jgi:hypothetical protein
MEILATMVLKADQLFLMRFLREAEILGMAELLQADLAGLVD